VLSFETSTYTAAASAPLFGNCPSGQTEWCGSGCGTCWEITPTGYSPTQSGNACGSCQSIIIMITNLCPADGNAQWCPSSGVNEYGYGQHFDLMDQNMDGIISAMDWNNPEVTYKQVACGTLGSPTNADWNECQCSQDYGTAASISASATTSTSAKASTTTTTSTSAKASTTTTTSTSAKASTSTTGSSTAYIVYGDALENGFQDWSWATHSLTNTNPVYSGSDSISFTQGDYTGLYFVNSAAFVLSPYSALVFYVDGGSLSGFPLVVAFVDTNHDVIGNTVSVPVAVKSGSWVEESIPISSFGISSTTEVTGFQIQYNEASGSGTFYVDYIYFA